MPDPFKVKKRSETDLPGPPPNNPFTDDDKYDPYVPTATLEIYEHINSDMSRKDSDHVNRASAATMCVKRRWYQRKGTVGKPLTPRKIVNFLLGDLTEKVLAHFIHQANVGPGKMYSEVDFGKVTGTFEFNDYTFNLYKQDTVHTKIGDIDVTGHADGYGKRNSDGKWELIEIKSAANYGFKLFKELGPEDYLKQAHVLMASDKCKELGITEVRFFYLRKETGNLYDRLHAWDEAMWEGVKEDYRTSAGDDEPPAPYGKEPILFRKKPTGEWGVNWRCSYCPYMDTCQGPSEIKWKKDQFGTQKPVHIFPRPQDD